MARFQSMAMARVPPGRTPLAVRVIAEWGLKINMHAHRGHFLHKQPTEYHAQGPLFGRSGYSPTDNSHSRILGGCTVLPVIAEQQNNMDVYSEIGQLHTATTPCNGFKKLHLGNTMLDHKGNLESSPQRQLGTPLSIALSLVPRGQLSGRSSLINWVNKPDDSL
ncbi:hypothetical protein Cgig2_013441 [Carnegiea gigantea]|uniref:Uncharacterized protein n=1 Tax=Carnegiea gigantea TaxID=171969 RepID=A0A9Q1K6M5_9CARY|nr:hypothetical protein Cgig2_013441 [Carnegiea gigantea]